MRTEHATEWISTPCQDWSHLLELISSLPAIHASVMRSDRNRMVARRATTPSAASQNLFRSAAMDEMSSNWKIRHGFHTASLIVAAIAAAANWTMLATASWHGRYLLGRDTHAIQTHLKIGPRESAALK